MNIIPISFPEIFPDDLIAAFQATERLTIAINPSEASCSDTYHNPYISKIGGIPYFPKDQPYPTNELGIPLVFMAQINLEMMFAELQKQDPSAQDFIEKDPILSTYPKQGMLSFFYDLSNDNYLMGLNIDRNPDRIGSQVRYFPVVSQDPSMITDQYHQILVALKAEGKLPDYGITEFNESFPLSFSLKKVIYNAMNSEVDEKDPHNAHLMQLITRYEESQDPALQAQYECLLEAIFNFAAESNLGSALSGYPHFTQYDPRDSDDNRAVLLFQIDSTHKIMIGDAGSMQFFIALEDFKHHNFNDVLYEWACY